MPIQTLCVYCGSNPGASPRHVETARAVGALLAREGVGLVYGGGRTGLMGALADSVLAAGGRVTGVMPRGLIAKEVAHRGLTELREVGTMHERKAMMAALADGFVALPGGVGTLEEITEVFTWGQLGFHAKPCALLDVEGFYAPLRAFLEKMVEQKFLMAGHLETLIVETDPAALLPRMNAWRPALLSKWTERATE